MARREQALRRALLFRLGGLGLSREPAARSGSGQARFAPRELQGELLRLCHEGALRGGLSAALDVRPEELLGPLARELGGAAARLKIVDVRGDAPVELSVAYGETTERWELEDLPALVHNLNDLYREDPGVKVAAVLGEWEDMLQLWCLEKRLLGRVLREPFFEPRNRAQLEAIAAGAADAEAD